MTLGHACGMPPTGANIAVLVLKTELDAGSSYTKQLAVVGLGIGMMVVWVPRTTAALLGAVCRCRCCCCCFVFSCLCLLACVGVLGHRRGTALGHPCGMPPTDANITVLLLKTWLAPDSTYT